MFFSLNGKFVTIGTRIVTIAALVALVGLVWALWQLIHEITLWPIILAITCSGLLWAATRSSLFNPVEIWYEVLEIPNKLRRMFRRDTD
jgi:hypothetical protein